MIIRAIIYFLLFFVSTVDASSIVSGQMLMGFEIETDGIKVRHDNEDEILVILESTDGKWQLTTDTQDTTSIAPTGWVNLEFRTVGGLTLKEIARHIRITQVVLARIKQACNSQYDGQCELSAIDFNGINVDGVKVAWTLPQQSILMAAKKLSDGTYKSLDLVLRPQLTFLFPLKMTRKFLKKVLQPHKYLSPRMFNLENKPREGIIKEKEESLEKQSSELAENEQAIKEVTSRIRSGELTTGDEIAESLCPLHQKKQTLEKSITRTRDSLAPYLPREKFFTPKIMDYLFSDEVMDEDLDGLCLLTASHIYDLFVENKLNPALKEPGSKGFLKIVSRFSFSDMYGTLSVEDRGKFNDFMQSHFESLFSQKIKPYRRDNPELCLPHEARGEKGTFIEEGERISLINWLCSIKDPLPRVRGLQDLLSPPYCVCEKYAMGALLNTAYPRCALIEVRGYANEYADWLKSNYPAGPTITQIIDSIETFIYDEATKFFSIE